MTEPTAEALAWWERTLKEETAGNICGIRELCHDCERPIAMGWVGGILACSCYQGGTPSGDLVATHGLHGLPNLRGREQRGARTYG